MSRPRWVKRRPFLAPIGLLLVATPTAAVALAVAAWWLITAPSLQVIVVPDPVSAASRSGDATSRSLSHAQSLDRLFGDVRSPGHLEALYVSADTHERTVVAPLAEHLSLAPIVLEGDAGEEAHRVLRTRGAERVLLLAPSGRVPALVEALIGQDLALPPDEDHLYVVAVPRFGRPSYVRIGF